MREPDHRPRRPRGGLAAGADRPPPQVGPDLRDPETSPATATPGAPATRVRRLGAVRAGPFGMTGLRDPHLVTTPTAAVRRGTAGLPHLDLRGPRLLPAGALGRVRPRPRRPHPARADRPALLRPRRAAARRPRRPAGPRRRPVAGAHLVVGRLRLRQRARPHTRDHRRPAHRRAPAGAPSRSPLPTAVTRWDPGLRGVDGRWYVSFVESASQGRSTSTPRWPRAPRTPPTPRRRPRVARGPAAARRGQPDLTPVRGPGLPAVGDDWWLLASDGEGAATRCSTSRCGERRPAATRRTPPTSHTRRLIPLPDGSQLLVTFDGAGYAEQLMGYGGHGDVLVMRSR